MPIPFLMLGLSVIYMIFYGVKIPDRIAFIVVGILSLLGFFIDNVLLFEGVMVNIILLFSILSAVSILMYRENLKSLIFYFIFLIFSSTIYLFAIYLNIELSTALRIEFIFIFTLVISIFLIRNIRLCISFVMSAYIFYELINILFVRIYIGSVTVISIDTFCFVIYSVAILLVLNFCYNFLKKKFAQEKLNV